MENPSELLPETNARDRLNNWIAISVALLAAFMAITKVKDDNIVQAMLQAKTDAVIPGRSIRQNASSITCWNWGEIKPSLFA